VLGCLLLVVLIKEQGEERTGSGAGQGRAGWATQIKRCQSRKEMKVKFNKLNGNWIWIWLDWQDGTETSDKRRNGRALANDALSRLRGL